MCLSCTNHTRAQPPRLGVALATPRTRVYALSLSPSPTFDNAGSLETGDEEVPRGFQLETCIRARAGM